MKSRDFVTEAFDQPYPYEWDKPDPNSYHALAFLDDGSPLDIEFNRQGTSEWHVKFDRNYSMRVTGEGNQQRVFATVIAAMKEFVKKRKPQKVVFSATKNVAPGQKSTSRSSLYSSLISRFATALGYTAHIDDQDDHVVYELMRVQKPVAEVELSEIQRTKADAGDDWESTGQLDSVPNMKMVPGSDRYGYVLRQFAGQELLNFTGSDLAINFYDTKPEGSDKVLYIGYLQFRNFNAFGFKNGVQVSNVMLDRRYRGKDIGVMMYTTALQLGYTIVADDSQTAPARKLWIKLNQTPNVVVRGLTLIMRGEIDPTVASGFTNQNKILANQKKLKRLGATPLTPVDSVSQFGEIPFVFSVAPGREGSELVGKNLKIYSVKDPEDTEKYVTLYAQWAGLAESVTESSGTTAAGYTWRFEPGREVPMKPDVDANTFIRVKDPTGKTICGVWADVAGDSIEIEYSQVFDERLRGRGVYTDLLKSLSKQYNVISDTDNNNAAAGIYRRLGADYDHRQATHTLRKQAVAEGKLNFEEGDCPIFAIALHRLSKMPLMALVEYDDQMGGTVLIHAYVKLDDRWRLDASGETDVDWMLQKYPNNGHAEEIEISEKDLLELGYGKSKCPTLQQVLPHAKEVLQNIEEGQQGVAEGFFDRFRKKQQNYGGIDVSVEKEDNNILVKATANGRELGRVLFTPSEQDDNLLVPLDLEVDERYRGQGIGATMYDYVKSLGYTIRRSQYQTDAGAGFWDKHKSGKNVWEQGVAEGSESAIQKIEKKIQDKRDALGLAREQRRMRGQHQQGQREIKIQAEIDRLSNELTQLKKQGVAEGFEQPDLMSAFKDFLPVAMRELDIKQLPPIRLLKQIPAGDQPTFGKFVNDKNVVYLGIAERHPVDILRTLAHELVHYKQNTEHQLAAGSGATGSPEENQAHEVAGIIMRDFNRLHPEYFKSQAVNLSAGVEHNKETLDEILVNLCRHVVEGQRVDPDKYGMVAACVIDPDNRQVIGVNELTADGTRRHGERVAMDRYRAQYGEIPEGSIVVTTCSPCNEQHMTERYGESCTDLINASNCQKVYCGFQDPSQQDEHNEFALEVTGNSSIVDLCGQFAATFLNENFNDGKNPGRKGLSQRVGIPKNATIAQLERYKGAPGEKGRMARWQLNMRRGRNK
jgi:pyrimidine deaminase RibD-like protein/GNAT superfamily N-acetyltransferase